MQCLLEGMKVKVGEGQEWDGRKGTREIKETECNERLRKGERKSHRFQDEKRQRMGLI